MNIPILIAFITYIAVLIGIGVIFSYNTTTSDDFMTGGHSVNYWVTAVATQASDMGSWLFMAFPGAIYSTGLIELWTAIGLTFFMWLNWHFIAPKLRLATAHYKSQTLSSFFEHRFNDISGTLRLLTAIITLVFFTFYIASGLVSLGRLFESAFELNYHLGIILGITAAIGYTLIGGFIAIAWCDFFQGMFLLTTIVLVPLIAYTTLDSWQIITDTAALKNVSLSLIPDYSIATLLKIISLMMGWGLGYFGQPHILANFMGIDDPKKIRYAKYVGITWQIIVLSAAALVGLVGVGYFSDGIASNELIFVIMAKQLFWPLIAGFALCAILAATLSTMDSHILVAANVVAEDIYRRYINPQASSKTMIGFSRVSAIILSSIALCMAYDNNSSIYSLVNYAWSGMGSAFGPLMITSLYWQKTNRSGALAGIIIGACVSALWPYLNTSIFPLVPGFFASLLTIIAVSVITEQK